MIFCKEDSIGRLIYKSLKEAVYEYLEESLRLRKLKAGDEISLEKTSRELGVSRTPLRDALLQLAAEGFVEIVPRKGIFVRQLSLQEIRDIYQIIGALEASVIRFEFERLNAEIITKMQRLNSEMEQALANNQFAEFYHKNLEFHNSFLQLSQNRELIKIVNNYKKRLYDFPPQSNWLKEWELSSVKEHQAIVDSLQQKEREHAAYLLSEVHWSFSVQEKFILKYYFPEGLNKSSG